MAKAVQSTPTIDTDQVKGEILQEPAVDSTVTQESEFLEDETDRQIKLERLKTYKEYNATLAQNNAERKTYAIRIFKLTCIWAFVIFAIVISQGLGKMSLSDKVLIALITSTTINFFGFFLLVVKYLFHTGAETKIASSQSDFVKVKTKKKKSPKKAG